mmetsp:Transcript_36152/g.84515  ORF Transcript_36152/g.84515 Transcript_36152/m.84515 type:complete len:542 (-) Transcript_36152:90-1715(-)
MDVRNLLNPSMTGFYSGRTSAIDHNQYVRGNFIYQANYRAGLRVLQINDIQSSNFEEIGFFDVYPANDNNSFNGAWSNYPFFPSSVVVVSGIEQGLFVLKVGGISSNPPTESLPTISPTTSLPTVSPTTSLPTISPTTPSPTRTASPTAKCNLPFELAIDESVTGASTNGNGIMFDVRVKKTVPGGILVDGFSINIGKNGTTRISIYTKKHNHVGYEQEPSVWTFLGTYQIIGEGEGNPTAVYLEQKLHITAEFKQAFYIAQLDSNDILYSVANAVKIGHRIAENEQIYVMVGTALKGTCCDAFGQLTIPKSIFIGTVKYTVCRHINQSPIIPPSLSPSLSHKPSTNKPSSSPTTSQVPSVSPTLSLSSNCEDSKVQEFIFPWNTLNCKKLFISTNAQQKKNRCSFRDKKGLLVRKYCPQTCGVCCEDTRQEFLFFWSSIPSNCKKLFASTSAKQKFNRCKKVDTNGLLVRKYCPETCGLCKTCEDSSIDMLFPWSKKPSNCIKLFKTANTAKKYKNRCNLVDMSGVKVKNRCRLTCNSCN